MNIGIPDTLQVILITDTFERTNPIRQQLESQNCIVASCMVWNEEPLPQITHQPVDIFLIDVVTPPDALLHLLDHVQSFAPKPMLMLTQDGCRTITRRVAGSGIFCYITDGSPVQEIRSVIEASMANFSRLLGLKEQLDELRITLTKLQSLEPDREPFLKPEEPV